MKLRRPHQRRRRRSSGCRRATPATSRRSISRQPATEAAGAIGERFAQRRVDRHRRAVAKKFYSIASGQLRSDPALDRPAAHPRRVRLRDDGRQRSPRHRQDIYDLSTRFGSGGRLRSLVVMDWLGKYPDDPTQKFLGENNTLSVLGQEVRAPLAGLRRLPRSQRAAIGRAARPRPGALELLLRFRCLGDGRQRHRGSWRRLFRTVDAVKRYSLLDQYTMGLVPTRPCRRSSTSRARPTCR